MAERHAGHREVVDVAAAAAQQPRILEPRDALPYRELAHRVPRALSEGLVAGPAEDLDYRRSNRNSGTG
jgi:hypothetical protein